jgi:hypothetical protein
LADERLGKRQPCGIRRREPHVGRAKGVLGVLSGRTKTGLCLLIIFEEHGIPDESLPARGQTGGCCLGGHGPHVDVTDSDRPCLQCGHMKRFEQPIDERFPDRRVLVL